MHINQDNFLAEFVLHHQTQLFSLVSAASHSPPFPAGMYYFYDSTPRITSFDGIHSTGGWTRRRAMDLFGEKLLDAWDWEKSPSTGTSVAIKLTRDDGRGCQGESSVVLSCNRRNELQDSSREDNKHHAIIPHRFLGHTAPWSIDGYWEQPKLTLEREKIIKNNNVAACSL